MRRTESSRHGRGKDEMVGEDIRQHRRTKRLAWSAAVLLMLLLVVAATSAWVAVLQRDLARGRLQRALAGELAAQSQRILLTQPPSELPLSALLAVEAAKRHVTLDVNLALRRALKWLPNPPVRLSRKGFSNSDIAINADGSRIFVSSYDLLTGYDGRTGATVFEVPIAKSSSFALDMDEDLLGYLAPNGELAFLLPNNGKLANPFDGVQQNRNPLRNARVSPRGTAAFSPNGRYFVCDKWLVDRERHSSIALPSVRNINRAVAFSPDNRHLAYGYSDSAVLWNLNDTREEQRFNGLQVFEGAGIFTRWQHSARGPI